MPRKEILHSLEMPENVRESDVATFSPDGRTIVTCEYLRKRDTGAETNQQLGLWDVETGERLRSIPCPRGDLPSRYYHEYPRSFTFSPDGKKALIVYRVKRTGIPIFDDYQELWDTVSWQPIRGRLHSWASSFTPDSQLYASTNCDAGHGSGLLNVETGDVVSSFGGPASYIQLSPDGRFAISFSTIGKGYTLWDPHTGGGRRFYPGYVYNAMKAVFYPDSRSVAVKTDLDDMVTGPTHNAITVWDISDLVQSDVGKEAREY